MKRVREEKMLRVMQNRDLMLRERENPREVMRKIKSQILKPERDLHGLKSNCKNQKKEMSPFLLLQTLHLHYGKEGSGVSH